MLQYLHRNLQWERWNEPKHNRVIARGHARYTQSWHLNHSNHPSHSLYNKILQWERESPPHLRRLRLRFPHGLLCQLASKELRTHSNMHHYKLWALSSLLFPSSVLFDLIIVEKKWKKKVPSLRLSSLSVGDLYGLMCWQTATMCLIKSSRTLIKNPYVALHINLFSSEVKREVKMMRCTLRACLNH